MRIFSNTDVTNIDKEKTPLQYELDFHMLNYLVFHDSDDGVKEVKTKILETLQNHLKTKWTSPFSKSSIEDIECEVSSESGKRFWKINAKEKR